MNETVLVLINGKYFEDLNLEKKLIYILFEFGAFSVKYDYQLEE